MSYPSVIVDTMNAPVECPNHNGSFDCNPFCRLCEGNQETTLDEMLYQADSVSFDGCHKIYLNMDAKQTEKMVGYGYDKTISDTPAAMKDLVFSWYEDSCSLRFIDAVFTDDDETDKFITVIGQFFGEDEDE
jgi:hypothetical protein